MFILKTKQEQLDFRLFEAIIDDNTKMIKALLKRGADPNASRYLLNNNNNSLRMSLINDAAWRGRTEAVRLLAAAGADINDGNNYMHLPPLYLAINNMKLETARLLADLGADLNPRNFASETPLHLYAKQGAREQLMFTIGLGADVNLLDQSHMTPLYCACAMGMHVKKVIVEALVSAGADPNIADSYGTTPLIRLASCGYTGMMKTLIRAGADISAENIFRHTALSKLKEQHPDKYNRFIQNTVVKSRQQTLKREDSRRSRRCVPDFDI